MRLETEESAEWEKRNGECRPASAVAAPTGGDGPGNDPAAPDGNRRRDCHFADTLPHTLPPSLSKRLLHGEGGAAE